MQWPRHAACGTKSSVLVSETKGAAPDPPSDWLGGLTHWLTPFQLRLIGAQSGLGAGSYTAFVRAVWSGPASS